MCYLVRHTTQFRYSQPVGESVMEVRKHPRSEGFQRCLLFELSVEPRARVLAYRDAAGNSIHHFNIPGRHTSLEVVAESVVEMLSPPLIPDRMDMDAWAELDELAEKNNDIYEMLMPSHFAQPTDLLLALKREWELSRRLDPLSLLREINTRIYGGFDYVKASTRADSPIDEALSNRHGVCQDFTHIMIALCRELGIPCRYCSGYLYHRDEEHDRSNPGATHAWCEALLPRYGWIGFDPTNELIAGTRHIRVAVGRDYADVPPTRGVYKGKSKTELSVAVQISRTNAPAPERVAPPTVGWASAEGSLPYYAPMGTMENPYETAPQQQQ